MECSTFPADSRTFSSKVNKGGFHAQNDGRLIAVMALAAVLSFLFINMTQKGTHKELVIQKDRAVIKRVDLGKVTADTKLTIDVDDGQMVIVYNKDGAWVESSPCPDKICIKEGRIQKPGETIACVPERCF